MSDDWNMQEHEENKEADIEEIKKEEEREDTTYHWVNPEYQRRRQQQEADAREQSTYGQNAYDQSAYEQNPYSQNTYDPNTRWQAQGPETGKRRYESYHFQTEEHGTQRAARQEKKRNRQKRKDDKKPAGFGRRFLTTVCLAVVFGLVAGGVMYGVNRTAMQLTGTSTDAKEREAVQIPSTEVAQPAQQESDETPSDTAGEYTVAQVAATCMPSVVAITNASVTTVRDFFGGTQEYPVESSGSGIIVGQNDTELLIATNNHVVADANTLTVAFCDDTVYEAQAKGTDSANDLAVIAVKLEDLSEETLSAIRVISIGDSDALQIGEQVVAIGNALGYGQSVTSGWVSAKDREMMDSSGNSSGKLIQTDAAINPGNSGGALLNMKGELIGINSAKTASTDVEGMGYAIPISVAEPVLDELMNRKTRTKVAADKAAYMGVTCLDVDSSAAERYGIPQGAFIDSILEDGPAQKAGILRGDVIVKVDDRTIASGSDLVDCMTYYEAGEVVDVVLYRAENGSYEEKTVTVTLARRSDWE